MGLTPGKREEFSLNKIKDAVPAPAKGKKAKKEDDTDYELEGLMSEIEGDLRTDEFRKIWQAYGNQIIAFAVILVMAVAGVQFYRQREARLHAEAGRAYELAVKAANDKKTDDAIAQLGALINGSDEGYRSLARLSQAALFVEQKKVDAAIANYQALAADTKADPVLRDLAKLLTVLHSVDKADPKALEAQLAPLLAPNSAFSPSAL